MRNNFFLLIGCLLFGKTLLAQNFFNSPYSRFGLGDLQGNVLSEFAAMGDASLSNYSAEIANPYNPATYTAFESQHFIFSLGGSHYTTNLLAGDLEQTTNFTSFSHLFLGFPITKKIGASMGMRPYSFVGYQMEDSEEIDEIGEVKYQYNGSGGMNLLYVGSAYRLFKHLSIGINANYIFGGIDKKRNAIFTDESFNTRTTSGLVAKGFFYQFGGLFDTKINENYQISISTNLSNNTEISAKQTTLTETYDIVSSIYEVVKDTAEDVSSGFTQSMNLPQQLAVGMAIRYKTKWKLMADYTTQNWQEFTLLGKSDSLANSSRISAGLEYVADQDAINNYWKLIRFRMGGKIENTPLKLNGIQLKEQTISFGVGLPLRKVNSYINLATVIGQRGTTEDNLIKEQFARFYIGLTLRDIWFVKRKFD